MASAFQHAVQRVLGPETRVETQLVASDPADEALLTQARDVDGVVELSFSPEGQKAHLHCYLAREKRWLDREISFGERHGSAHSEISERGRLLGFAVATMYAADTSDAEHPTETQSDATSVAAPAPASPSVAQASAPRSEPPPPAPAERSARRIAEFSAIVTGLKGAASGLGASAGFRMGLTGPVWARLFVAGRSGNIPEAQASTRTALMGGGVAFSLLPESSTFDFGTRLDLFASYFDASHLSEDDTEPDRQSRWQLGGDWVLEGGVHFTRSAGLFLGGGVEAVLGKTYIYTHQVQVAVVPPFRATAELGFRTRF